MITHTNKSAQAHIIRWGCWVILALHKFASASFAQLFAWTAGFHICQKSIVLRIYIRSFLVIWKDCEVYSIKAMSKEKAEVVKDVLSPAMQRRLSSRGAAVEQPDYASLHSGRPPRQRLSEGEGFSRHSKRAIFHVS